MIDSSLMNLMRSPEDTASPSKTSSKPSSKTRHANAACFKPFPPFQLSPLTNDTPFPLPTQFPKSYQSPMTNSQTADPNRVVRTADSFHQPNPRQPDPRETRTRRSMITPRAKILVMQLGSNPVVSILILPVKTPANARITANTAPNPHGHWRAIATKVQLPVTIKLPCHASELDVRLLRACVYSGRRQTGDFVIPVRSVLEGGGASVGVGKRSVVYVQGLVGSYSGWSLRMKFSTGRSVRREVKGCRIRMRRTGGGRNDVVLGEWGFRRDGSCRMSIAGEVLWFGLKKSDASMVRLVMQVLRKGLFEDEQVIGEIQVGLEEIGSLTERQVLRVAWWRAGSCSILLAVVESMELASRGLERMFVQLRLTR